MFKTIFAAALVATTAFSATTAMAAADAQSFSHDGVKYVYTVKQVGSVRVLRGTATPGNEPFELTVSDKWVKGTVNSNPVAFRISAVKPIATTEVASR